MRKVKISSVSRPLFYGMGFLGLLFGIFYSVGGLFYDLAVSGSLNPGTLLAFFALVGMPLTFSVFGFVLGVVGASLNNLVVRLFAR